MKKRPSGFETRAVPATKMKQEDSKTCHQLRGAWPLSILLSLKERERKEGKEDEEEKHFNISDLFQGPPLSMMFLVWCLFLSDKSDTLKKIRKPHPSSLSSRLCDKHGKAECSTLRDPFEIDLVASHQQLSDQTFRIPPDRPVMLHILDNLKPLCIYL